MSQLLFLLVWWFLNFCRLRQRCLSIYALYNWKSWALLWNKSLKRFNKAKQKKTWRRLKVHNFFMCRWVTTGGLKTLHDKSCITSICLSSHFGVFITLLLCVSYKQNLTSCFTLSWPRFFIGTQCKSSSLSRLLEHSGEWSKNTSLS